MTLRYLAHDDSAPLVLKAVALESGSAAAPLTILDGTTRTVVDNTQEDWPLVVVVDGTLTIDGVLLVGG